MKLIINPCLCELCVVCLIRRKPKQVVVCERESLSSAASLAMDSSIKVPFRGEWRERERERLRSELVSAPRLSSFPFIMAARGVRSLDNLY